MNEQMEMHSIEAEKFSGKKTIGYSGVLLPDGTAAKGNAGRNDPPKYSRRSRIREDPIYEFHLLISHMKTILIVKNRHFI